MLSLRPVGDHAALRRAVAGAGGRLIALSPWRIEPRHDPAARKALRHALSAPVVVFTSPAAVSAASLLAALRATRGRTWLAVGNGTARALQRAGVGTVETPQRMDSEGLLALPALASLRGQRVGLVTAPGGRDRIAAVLVRRGAHLLRAEVYDRMPVKPSARGLARLRTLRKDPWLALSSGQALELALQSWPADAVARLRRARVVAASERLAALARSHGLRVAGVATSARPADLVAAMR